jgi:hypothetical protein
MVNAYGALANGGIVFEPRVVRSVLSPGTRNKASGLADLPNASVVKRVSQETKRTVIPMRPDVIEPVVSGLRRVITGPGVDFDYYHKTTGENLFRNYTGVPIAGKTGTAQGFNNLPWNDSSAFGAFSMDTTQPYSAFAYLEKAGYGAVAAAPVVKCLFLGQPRPSRSTRYGFEPSGCHHPATKSALSGEQRTGCEGLTWQSRSVFVSVRTTRVAQQACLTRGATSTGR